MQRILQAFYCCPNMIDVFNQKQMYNSVITEKESASEDWNCINVSEELQYLFWG